MSRPEHQIPAELFYGVDSARKYAHSSRVQFIQRKMTVRAMELMNLPEDAGPCHLLDIGCGSGIGGEVLEGHGHTWTGVDISMPMLQVARERESYDMDDSDDDDEETYNNVQKDCLRPMVEVARHDMGLSLPFRPGSFDGAISISAIQWLCVSEKKGDVPQIRIKTFFQSLVAVLRRGARAVFQFYPENNQQLDMLSTTALKCGFEGGVVVDFPHSTRAKKYYLVLSAGKAPGGYRPAELSGLQTGAAEENDYEDEGEGWENEDDNLNEEAEEWEDEEEEDDERISGGKRARVERRGTNHKNPHDAARKRRRIEKMKTVAKARPKVGTRSWVIMKKQQRAKRGENTVSTKGRKKYSARRRPGAF